MPSAPTLVSCDQDFASAGGGDVVTFHGTNLLNGLVTVDGAKAKVTRSAAGFVRFTVPASPDDSIDGLTAPSVVTVTTAEGSATSSGLRGNRLWYVPSYRVPNAGVWSAQRVVTIDGTLAVVMDLSGNGNHLTPIVAGPRFTPTGGGPAIAPFWTHPGVNVDNRLASASFPVLTTNGEAEVVFAGSLDAAPSESSYLFRLGMSAGPDSAVLYGVGGQPQLAQYETSAPANAMAVALGEDLVLLSNFRADASSQILNGILRASGGNPGTGTATAGAIVGGDKLGEGGASYNYGGRVRLLAVYPGSLTPLQRAAWSSCLTTP